MGNGAQCGRRLALVDAVKAVAAQLIVLHHLAWYGPLSDVAADLSPLLEHGFDWLADYGRYAVAAFLAVGGFLAAQGLPLRGLPDGVSPLRLIGRRYLRLAGPYAVALLLVTICAALARRWMTHDSIGAAPTLGQFVAHLFLLHDLLGYEALSAGVWYVAIDFQLYALLVALLWAAGRLGRRLASAEFVNLAAVAALAAASLLVFNRAAGWDVTALYFFGSYALGLGSGWAVRSAHPWRFLLLLGIAGALALGFEFRARIAVALVVALLLGIAQLRPPMAGGRLAALLGQTSYALFLVHFPVCLLVSAAFQKFAPPAPLWNALGVLAAWLASNAAALLFHRFIEARLGPQLSALLQELFRRRGRRGAGGICRTSFPSCAASARSAATRPDRADAPATAATGGRWWHRATAARAGGIRSPAPLRQPR